VAKTDPSEILEKAAAMFAEKGYEKMDVQTLADHLKIGKGTVYRHFTSKEELFLASANHAFETLIPIVRHALSQCENPIDKLKAAYKTFLIFFEKHPEYAELLMQDRAIFKNRSDHTYFRCREELIGKHKQFVESLITQKVLRNIASEKIVQVFLTFLYGALYVRFFTVEQYPLHDLADDVLDILFHGILNK
jgi:AcrR family transcriptional regulator